MSERKRSGPVLRAGVVLGIGLGGFLDGIVLHGLLRWHHMLSSAGYPPTSVASLEVNEFWDGMFLAFTWIVTVVGIALLWRALRRADSLVSTKLLVGSTLGGWGLFNLVEGIVDHQILGIHHVRPGPNQLAWDLGFLAFGAVLVLIGWVLARDAEREASGTPPTVG